MSKTKEPKILQIMPAPPEYYEVSFSDEDGSLYLSPVICLALVEEDNLRYVKPLSFDSTQELNNLGLFDTSASILGYYMKTLDLPPLAVFEEEAKKRLALTQREKP